MPSATKLLSVKNLKKHYPIYRGVLRSVSGWVKAVDDVSIDLLEGEVLGLVGESGCGKTTVGRAVLRLVEPTSGEVYFYNGSGEVNILALNKTELKKLRPSIQIIYQDPQSSLNERMTVGSIITEPLAVHKIGSRAERLEIAEKLLSEVGLKSEHMGLYPHEFSGGQRQRIAIARSLSLKPRLIIADEAVSALDVSIQSQILLLLKELQQSFGLTYIFISHDLSVVRYISDRIAVMYLGRVVELSPKGEFFEKPLHPYSEALISAVPIPDPDYTPKRIVLQGDVPNPISPPEGCHFHPRCPYAESICLSEYPPYQQVTPGHFVSCHLVT
jgi:oligopeptide/dipeptide ABC transporter ATP-binding protein